MNLRQFAINNVLRNKRTYVAHFLSSAFSVMIFFIYALLLFHPDLQGELESTSDMISALGTMGMKVAQIIIFIFSFFFLLYSVSAFLKLRKKEFGIMMILGMSRKQFYRLLFVENMMIGCAAIIVGIVAGTLISKILLIISANILAIEKGLAFYFPIKAALVTAGAFLLLFLLISLFTSRLIRTGTILELVKAEEKPKPEPKVSPWLSILAIVLLAAGYGMVLCFAILQIISLSLLLSGVGLTILGTYFLFTQLSVYSIRNLKKRSSFFYKKTNMVTISELMYRMKDNAIMFFLVSVISASAFTGIGTCLALGNSGLSEMTNPYAFSYTSFNEKADKADINMIKQELAKAGIPYTLGTFTPASDTNGNTLIKLSEYNVLAKALGYQTETLSANQALLSPSTVKQKNDWRIEGQNTKQIELVQEQEQNTIKETVNVKRALSTIVLPELSYSTIIVSDQMYEKFISKQTNDEESYYKEYRFIVKNWQETKDVAQTIAKKINPDHQYNFNALVLNWLSSKQANGLMLILSGLVGIVFFTFAASFIYFRLYADLDRDIQQYRMISKIGLSKKELSQIVTRQLVLLFFLPIIMAIIHGSVAFFALQRLVDFSVFKSSILIFITFGAAQVVYFFIARWRYLNHLHKKMQ